MNSSGPIHSDSSAGGDTKEKLNLAVNVAGQYRACYVNTNPSMGVFRFTFDLVGPSCDANPDACYGARGPNCSFCPSANVDTMLRNCPVSVGSNKHDQCCSEHPSGYNCGAPGSVSCPPATGWWAPYHCCRAEWDRGSWDLGHGREYHSYRDPTTMYYKPDRSIAFPDSVGTYTYGAPKRGQGAILAPYDRKILKSDADEGWCAGAFPNAYVVNPADGSEVYCR